METQEFEIRGKPYFIRQVEGGLFYAVSKILIERDNSNLIETANISLRGEPLRVGLEIIEKPTRGISLLVRARMRDFIRPIVLGELSKFAEIGNYDYFSYEDVGDSPAPLICTDNDGNGYYSVRPRLFRKIVDN